MQKIHVRTPAFVPINMQIMNATALLDILERTVKQVNHDLNQNHFRTDRKRKSIIQ